jgi:hypothetical protein
VTSGVPVPLQAPVAQPAHETQLPLAHCASLVHQQGMPAPSQAAVGLVTLLQLPIAQAYVAAAATTLAQPATSGVPEPEHVPVHRAALTQWPLEQFESATHEQAVCAELQEGAGESVVTHAYTLGFPEETAE